MKQLIISFLFFYCSTALAHNKIGNGGGGYVTQTGIYNLFVTTPSDPLHRGVGHEVERCESEIFEDIKNDIQDITFFAPEAFGKYLTDNPCPKGFRSVARLDVSKDYLFSNRLKYFKFMYAKATGTDPENVIIYAMNMPEYDSTFLFEEFYGLSYLKQKIIIFHEIFWDYYFEINDVAPSIEDEVLLYKQILRLDQALGDYLVKKNEITKQNLQREMSEFENFNF